MLGTAHTSDHNAVGVDITLKRLRWVFVVVEFGALIWHRTSSLHTLRDLELGEKAGETKVADLRVYVVGDEDIVGLEVAMDNPCLVEEL